MTMKTEKIETRDSAAAQRRVSRRAVLKSAAWVAGGALVGPWFIRPARAQSTIKVMQMQSLTGPSAAYGIRARDGALMAVNEVNAAGGVRDRKGNVYRLEMVAGDIANDPKQAITLLRQSALDPAFVCAMGPTNSVGFVPLVPVAGQMKIPLIGNGSGAPIKKWNEWAYRVNPVAQVALPVTLQTVTKREGIKRLAVIYDQTQDAQAGDALICKEQAAGLGYELVAFQAFRNGDQDFSAQIAIIKNATPDAVFVAASTGDGIKVVTQLRGAGLAQPLLTGNGSFDDSVYWDGTSGGILGSYTYVSQDFGAAPEAVTNWLKRYNEAFSLKATAYSLFAAGGVWTLAECIKRGGIRREEIREVLASLSFEDPLGAKVTFKNPPHGDNLTPTVTVVKITGRGSYSRIV